MRTFRYSFDGQEAHIDLIGENNAVLFTANFPTPSTIKHVYRPDFRIQCANHNVPQLTDEEWTALDAVVAGITDQ